MTRALKSIVALAAITVIVGQVGSKSRAAERRADEPEDQQTPGLSNAATTKVLLRACGNCHSNRTNWPWYSYVAPVSWWIAHDVHEGRTKFNISEWETYSAKQKRDRSDSICGLISTGRMPPWLYTTMHPEARITEQDKKTVCAWAKAQTIKAAE